MCRGGVLRDHLDGGLCVLGVVRLEAHQRVQDEHLLTQRAGMATPTPAKWTYKPVPCGHATLQRVALQVSRLAHLAPPLAERATARTAAAACSRSCRQLNI